MAKRGRPRIHPPKIPNGEDPQITIGNQANQINLLISRVQELVQERDKAWKRLDTLQEESQAEKEQLSDLSDAYSRLNGWQDCAREIITMLMQGKT